MKEWVDLHQTILKPSETHKGLKRATLTIMFAWSDAHEFSFLLLPHLEQEEKITNQSYTTAWEISAIWLA